ncbi:hypothetical protein KSS82_14245 [Vibrio mimicus]|nr:hypothetical protein [Vibrio mimicus]QXC56448.1 hypothetical protein KSS82_14245 [Vibrio mimicus]
MTKLDSIFLPSKGLFTFESEGQEGGRYHSRILQVPSLQSGLTIGRGYDCKDKSSLKIENDLLAAGISHQYSKTIALSSGLAGEKVKSFITQYNLSNFEITPEQQLKLFELIYNEMENDVIRICNKEDCIIKYGSVIWNTLPPPMKDITVDLRFRGDYTPISRQIIQPSLAENDHYAFMAALSDQSKWSNVPMDRFQRRRTYLMESLKLN